MNDLITPKANIEIEAKNIQMYLEITVSDNIEEIQQRGNDLSVHMARSGKLLADAKYHQDEALTTSILSHLDTGLSPSGLNKLIGADCKEENYLVNWMDRINRTSVHQIDWIRSVLSKAKEEMKQSNF